MGTVATRCLKGCEGGKKEVGEEYLENIIKSDSHFMKELIDSCKGCENIDPFKSHKLISDSIQINKLYKE